MAQSMRSVDPVLSLSGVIFSQIARLGQSITTLPPSSEQNEPGVAVTDFPCGPLMKNIWSASVPPLLSCPQYDQAM